MIETGLLRRNSSGIRSEKLSKHLRLLVYSYLPANVLLFKVSKVSNRERKEVAESGIIGKNRHGTIRLPSNCWLDKLKVGQMPQDLQYLLDQLGELTIIADYSQICHSQSHSLDK